MHSERPTSIELRFSSPGAFGVLEEIVVSYPQSPARRRVRGTHWKSNARTDVLAAALALLVLREGTVRIPALLDSRNGPAEARLCAKLHDLWHSPRKRIESHWLDAVFDLGARDLASPLSALLVRSGGRETTTFRFSEGFSAAGIQFTRGGVACSGDQLWAFLGARFGIVRPRRDVDPTVPVYQTSLVGRDDDLAKLLALVEVGRLVTIVGPSGVGKTRLALEVAARTSGFADGARLIDLTSARSREQVIRHLLEDAGLATHEGEVAAERFRDRAFLLVFDNCEKVRAAAAEVASELLAVAPRTTVLATALEPLAVQGETCYRLRSLALPDPSARAEDALRAPAIRLFLDRAVAADRNHATVPSAEEIRAIGALCRSVGGLPLGIELAAAASGRFPLADVDRLLFEHLDLLEGSDRNLPARHASLRALFTWTCSLLTTEERRILGSLSVFPHDWSLDAACAICRDIDIGPAAALRGHARLVDLSLIQLNGKHRFGMLPSVRAFAATLLAASPFAERVWTSFEEYFLALAESLSERGGHPPRGVAERNDPTRRLRPEAASLRHAAALACERGRREGAVRFVEALYPFWLDIGAWSEGREICTQALALSGLDAHSEARISLAAAGFAYRLGDIFAAREHYQRVRNLASGKRADQGRADPALLADAVHGLGVVAYRTGQLGEAEIHFGEAAAIWQATGDERRFLLVMNNLAAIAAAQGCLAQAATRFASVAELAGRSGDRRIVASALMNCGLAHLREERAPVARGYLQRSLELFRELDDAWGEANVCNTLGVLALAAGDHAECARYHARSLVLRTELGDRAGIVASLEGFAIQAAASGEAARALRLFAACRTLRSAAQLELTADNQREVDAARDLAAHQLTEADCALEERIGATYSLQESVAFAQG